MKHVNKSSSYFMVLCQKKISQVIKVFLLIPVEGQRTLITPDDVPDLTTQASFHLMFDKYNTIIFT